MKPLRTSAAVSLLLLGATPAWTDDQPGGVVMQAMRDELARSMQALEMERMEKPYFMAYRIDDLTVVQAVANFGALTDSSESRNRILSIEVRVGNPDLDNTNFMPARVGRSPATRSITLPLDDDYKELRRQLWLNTDGAYKHALETLAKKRAALQNRTREEIPDFIPAEPHTSFTDAVAPAPTGDLAEDVARELSAVFKDFASIHASRARASHVLSRSYYVNSEGTAFTESQPSVFVEVLAKTQADDGTVLQDFEAFYGNTWEEITEGTAPVERVRAMAAALGARREAAVVERYSGPVLFEGQAAAELFTQVLAAKLIAVRVPVAEDARMERFTASLRNPFEDKIGARVLPRGLNVRDDPTLQAYAGMPLHGGYTVDDDGVPAGPTTLIENGVLKTLLGTRNPIAGIAHSTGNRRMMGIALPSNLIVTATRGLSAEELREEFRLLIGERGSEYGIVVRRLANPMAKLDRSDAARTTRGEVGVDRLTRAFKVYRDGREEPIRKAELSGISESDFKDIVAVSDTTTNYTLGFVPTAAYSLVVTTAQYGAAGTQPAMSIAVPDLLFEELTLRKPAGNVPLPPVATHPYFN